MEYVFHIVIMLNIYIMLVLSANITSGMTNLLTMCQAAFYGIGAYIGAFFLFQFELSITAIILFVSLLSGIFSLIVSYSSIKLKGDFFVLATIGFQLIFYTILYNWTPVTNGSYGISGIPGLSFLGIWELSGVDSYLLPSFILMALTVFLCYILQHSPYGRLLQAIKADELTVESMGRSTSAAKTWAFFISAAIAGVAGVIYASYVKYIDPSSFTIGESIFIISALFIGGIGNIKGPVFGAFLIVILPELLRFIGLPEAIAANLRQIIFGLALVLIIFFRPQGLFGKKAIN